MAGFVVFPTVISGAAALIDVQRGDTPPILGGTDYTPLFHASSMLSLALLAPWSMLITWRTGGLEIAVMLHAGLNTATFTVALNLRVNLGSALQDRSAGTGSPYLLVMASAVVVITAIVWWSTRRTGPALTPAAPGATTEEAEVGAR